MGIQDKVTGRVKQAAGDLLGDESIRQQGAKEERKGEVKQDAAEAQREADEKSREASRLESQT
jgi:uncharacterized protein YjbJ (UPF0337 family)